MQLIHPRILENIKITNKLEDKAEKIRSAIGDLLTKGFIREMARKAAIASDNIQQNRTALNKLIGGLLQSPLILQMVGTKIEGYENEKYEKYISDLFFVAFRGINIDVEMDPTVPIKLHNRKQ